jgi:hypothetical protein
MAAKKKAKPQPPTKRINKSAFVRSLPATMPAKEIVARAQAQGFKITEVYIYSLRAKARAAAKLKTNGSPAKRGPGRPPKTVRMESFSNAPRTASGGFESALERLIVDIVERQVAELLRTRLETLFGR